MIEEEICMEYLVLILFVCNMGCKLILFLEKVNKKKMFKDWEFNVLEKKNYFKMLGRFNLYKFDRRLIM